MHPFFLVLCWLAMGCSETPSAGHEEALPHHNAQPGGQLSAKDAEKLASAKGRTATLVAPADLMTLVRRDTAPLLAVNFWKNDCPACLHLLHALQQVQLQNPGGKLKIIAVNLESEATLEQVNLQLRTAGITVPVFLLQDSGKTHWHKDFYTSWQGSLPALLLRSNDGFQQFFQQELSEKELTALVLPFLN